MFPHGLRTNEFVADETAAIHPNAPKYFAANDTVFTVDEEGKVLTHTIIKSERGWYGYLLGGISGIYRYEYESEDRSRHVAIHNGGLFRTQEEALLSYVETLRRKIDEYLNQISLVNDRIGDTINSILDLK